MKICIVSVSDRPSLSEGTFARLEAYAAVHGYDCILHHKALDTSRHISWSKLKALDRALSDSAKAYDLVVWIDDDILITDTSKPFTGFHELNSFMEDHKAMIMVSADVEQYPLNAGMLFIKGNISASVRLVRKLWEMGGHGIYREYQQNANWEQEVIVAYYEENNAAFHIIPHGILQSFLRDRNEIWKRGDFAAHITGMALNKRLDYLKMLIDSEST